MTTTVRPRVPKTFIGVKRVFGTRAYINGKMNLAFTLTRLIAGYLGNDSIEFTIGNNQVNRSRIPLYVR